MSGESTPRANHRAVRRLGTGDDGADHWSEGNVLRQVEGFEEAAQATFEDGVRSVIYIRCIGHRAVPAYNHNELAGGDGGECAACAVVDLEQHVKALAGENVALRAEVAARQRGRWGRLWSRRA